MKKLLFVSLLLLSCSFGSYAQVTKAGVEKMLTELGTNMDNIKTFYIGNVKVFYNDGTWKTKFSKFGSTWSEGTNTFALSTEGIMIRSYKGTALDEIQVFPFSAMKKIQIQSDYIGIELKD